MIFFIEMSKIVIIEYRAGNLFSVRVAIERLGYEVVCSADPRVVREADKVIFPGVGQAAAAMRAIEGKRDGSGDSGIEGSRVGDMFGNAVDVCYSEEGGDGGIGNIPRCG